MHQDKIIARIRYIRRAFCVLKRQAKAFEKALLQACVTRVEFYVSLLQMKMANEIIKLCVGGVRYETTLGTLTAVPGSMLASLFYEDWELPVTDDGWLLLDRNGEIFQYVLGYLRGSSHLPSDRKKLDLLADEAIYFGLRGLIAEIADHDLNSRELKLHLSEECKFTLRIDELRRERYSLLAGIAEHVSSVIQPNNHVLHLSWGGVHSSEIDHATESLSIFRNFEMDLVVPDGPFDDMQFPRIMAPFHSGHDQPARSLRTRAYVLQCALQALVDYLRVVELKVPNSMKTLKELVDNDFAEMNADLTWNDVQKVLSERIYLQTILIPTVINVAKYFNMQKLKRLAEENLSDLSSLV